MILERRAALGVGAVALLGVAAYFAFRATDESRIRGKLGKLAAAVRVEESDGQANPILRHVRVSETFAALFDPDVRVSISELGSFGSGRAGLEELAAEAPRFFRTLDVDFGKVTVKLDDQASSAAVGAVAKVKATERDGQARADARAVDLRFVKRDGEWIIATVTVLDQAAAAP